MKQLIIKSMVDHSDSDTFRFAIVCDECKTEWHSTSRRFSKAGILPETEAKELIFKSICRREHARAQTLAIEEAAHHFNLCPICNHLVCNKCFMICDDLDMCASCAKRLKECGESVAS